MFFDHKQVNLVSTVHGRIRTLLQSEMDVKRMKESLIDLDLYIAVKVAEAKQVALAACPSSY